MMEGLKESDADLIVYVHPSKGHKVTEAVLRQLSSMLLKFDEKFEGVLLAYGAKITDKTAKILSGVHPYFGVRLQAKLLLFSPKPDMLLEGKVVKLKQESIHVIVLGFASAVITDENVREEFKHRSKRGKEMFVSKTHKHHLIKVGTMIRFLVKSFDEEILHISGSLVPSHTGSIYWLEKNLIDSSVTNRSTKKSRDHDGESLLQGGAAAEDSAFILNNDHHLKSKKQKISRVS